VLNQTAVEDYRYAPEERRSPWKYVLIALLVLGVLGLLAWVLADQFLAGDVRVPRVIGMDEDEAIAELQNAGLRVEIRDRPHRRAEEGTVFNQDPGEGESVEEGSTVTILVSAGIRQVVVPNLEGLTEDEARGALDEARLELGEVTQAPNEEVEAGLIFDQNPSADSEVDAGTRVAVTVSTGAEAVVVPNVINQTEEQAVANLEALGFSVEVTSEPNEAPEGTVFAQDPEGGTEAVPVETTVVIAVSEGPEEPPMPDVTGEDADEAEEFLENEYGLEVSQEEEIEECVLPPGTVCRQDPEPNTPISEGDSAVLYVLPD
jgi:eukaryotic-like serine/threonine-protein kinase